MRYLVLILIVLSALTLGADKCKAITLSGKPCSRTAVINGLCNQHNAKKNNTTVKKILVGKQGGKYYLTSKGVKVYVK